MLPIMLILGLILFGMLVGAGAQLIMGKSAKGIDWTLALVAGLVGSFVGGLLISLLSGDGLQFRASGIIGSLVGALLVTAGWQWYRRRVGLRTPDLGWPARVGGSGLTSLSGNADVSRAVC
jgi:uncharacterized membrane protein YeaQ/YmgE (transglycosylase-associated protein family)